ncbi:hypothetical protein LSH36_1002g03117 [Paralvinella palmiformis]|uniref:Uncharacterized protein n=1 Tax=Paralvinella palmiformis TaxID=53620 RepID=A0AAD9IXU0_9ANNE|nr:hypothetical protein LSH36_1002g03117 [Paralvinella palmiformis]
MALNKYMHPRNVYKDRKPNFKKLAEKYEEFHKHVLHDDHGTVQIDFKKPECLRALSWALLKDDFNLDVLMPLDRLIPTIPLRLNYILWLEDILDRETETICGIDIGTGASCVYPLLGAKKNGWSFIATESDGTNYQYAKKNVENNQMTDKIKGLNVWHPHHPVPGTTQENYLPEEYSVH